VVEIGTVGRRPRRARVAHPDVLSIEARKQTAQKVELWSRYPETWATIIAQTSGLSWCNRHMFIVDAMAGDGRHESASHPEGWLPGTAILAVRAAARVQHDHPEVVVHVRATEIDPARAEQLRRRAARHFGRPPEGVDVEVFPEAFADRRDGILTEIAAPSHPHSSGRAMAHRHRSLWLIDPYGLEEIPHDDLVDLGDGSEVVINLDVSGIWRLIGLARSTRANEVQVRGAVSALDTLYGDRSWDAATRGLTAPAVYRAIAEAYAQTFRSYTVRQAYPLHGTRSQFRFLIHLATSPSAERAFASAYKTSFKAGTLIADGALTAVEKRRAAEFLWGKFRGMTITISEMRELGVAFDATQLHAICGIADAESFGRYDAASRSIEWKEAREMEPDLTLGL
jgi:three-Cys-motif partner protein